MTVYRNVSALILRRLPLKANNGSGNGNLKDFTRMPDEVLYLVVKKLSADFFFVNDAFTILMKKGGLYGCCLLPLPNTLII